MMDALIEAFEERQQEIEAYLAFLEAVDRQVMQGTAPKVGNTAITVQQQRILYSSVYLQLYNLVESTITRCLEAVCAAAAQEGRWFPVDLSEGLQREWVRVMARTHKDLSYESRWDSAFTFFKRIATPAPVLAWELEHSDGGNWDDRKIEDVVKRLGWRLQVSPDAYQGIKQFVKDEKGVLGLVRDLRNQLAHGRISFAECSDGVTLADLKDLSVRIMRYLREVVEAFKVYIRDYEFLIPERRPSVGTDS